MLQFKKYLVTLSPKAKLDKEAAINQLAEAGLEIVKVYPFGVVSGNTTSDRIEYLSNLDSVISISEEKTIRLPPGNSEVQ